MWEKSGQYKAQVGSTVFLVQEEPPHNAYVIWRYDPESGKIKSSSDTPMQTCSISSKGETNQ